MFLKKLVGGVPIPWDPPGCSGLVFLLHNPLHNSHLRDFLPCASLSIRDAQSHSSPPVWGLQGGECGSGVRKINDLSPKVGCSHWNARLCPPLHASRGAVLSFYFLNTCKSSGLGPAGLKRAEDFAFPVFLCQSRFVCYWDLSAGEGYFISRLQNYQLSPLTATGWGLCREMQWIFPAPIIHQGNSNRGTTRIRAG